jgi:FkbM family methyltransferase
VSEDRDLDPVPSELRDGDVVIEAGAYEGAWALKVCQQRPNCRLYAFEPASRAYEIACEKLRGYPNVVLQSVALGKQNGTAVLCDRNRDGANILGHNPEGEQSETVTVVDVAEVVEPLGEIALAHFNAEGGEIDIVERLLDAGLIGRFKAILVQWHFYDERMVARIEEMTRRLSETHRYEHRVVWGYWGRKEEPCL